MVPTGGIAKSERPSAAPQGPPVRSREHMPRGSESAPPGPLKRKEEEMNVRFNVSKEDAAIIEKIVDRAIIAAFRGPQEGRA